MLTESGYPVSVACQAAGIPRSSYYYKPQAKEEDALREAIEEVAAKYPTYGSRRIAAQLGREPYNLQVNRKRVVRLMRELGLVRKPKRKPVRTTDSSHPHRRYPNLVAGLEVSYPDQVWVADITYIRLKKGFVYLAVVMDLFTRGIRGWALSRFLDHDLALEALKMALGKGVPKVHHSDQGVQYAAKEYVELLEKHEAKISMARRGRPDENGYAERVIRTIKEEEVELSEYEGFWDAKDRIGEFIEEVYQKKRIHSALGYLTPAEFEAKWYEQEAEAALLSKGGPKLVQFLGSTTKSSGCFPEATTLLEGAYDLQPELHFALLLDELAGSGERECQHGGIPPFMLVWMNLRIGGMPHFFKNSSNAPKSGLRGGSPCPGLFTYY